VEFNGAGMILANSYLGMLFSNTTNLLLGHTDEMLRLGTYILWQVKKSGYGCGGKTDTCILYKDGNIETYAVRHFERMFAQLDIVMRRLLLMHSGSLSDANFEEELSFIAQRLRDAKADNKKYDNPIAPLVEGLDPD
jgi:hypothetical protein